MHKLIEGFDKEIVELEISGGKFITGSIIDSSNEIIVIFDGTDYLYIPLTHIHNIMISSNDDDSIDAPTEPPSILSKDENSDLTLAKVLEAAKGIYTEIYVTGSIPLHGYISKIMDDYFVFQSPVYKTMYIALDHLKWIIPYPNNNKPYGLTDLVFSVKPYNISLSNIFEKEIEQMKHELVVVNLGEKNHYLGRINNIIGRIVEIQTARGQLSYITLDHIRTIHRV
ncbi:DUF2642 domain-containing protein [Rummeliibacillus sp. JY-2-4R]